MKFSKEILLGSVIGCSLLLGACDKNEKKQPATEQKKSAAVTPEEKAKVLPYLNIQEKSADIALPFCETKNCINLDIQTLKTADSWLNQSIEKQQAKVIQDQIGLKQDMSVQQAVNAYVKKSDAWQAQLKLNKAYELSLYTRIPYQRNQFVLMQIGVDSTQENIRVNERYYFFVADRLQQKILSPLDIINPEQQLQMDQIVQQAYQKWLKDNNAEVQQKAPKKLYWGQTDWFFDQEGIGLHYRSQEISKDAKQLDIYLTKEQTQQVLKVDIYQNMF
ncbi:hypothetical protein L1A45_08950 [Acinetobacter variabilis]|uniref:hypothetical protein n=1 Tax=Acinetobacter TaxID=469 RepID=UPI0025B7E02E|nr:hypothetical protein [Acinetobacter sp. UBA3025]